MQDAVATELKVDLCRRIHFSLQQNDVPVIRTVQIENRSGQTAQDLTLSVSTEPPFALPWSTHIARLDPGAVYPVPAVDLELSPGLLGELTERLRGRMVAELRRGEEVLAVSSHDVELLARDEWPGLAVLPEILAAFVLPNHPAVEQILRAASDLLGSWTDDPALNGYQSRNRTRAYMTAASVYGALQGLELTYVNPPASFEEEGQRVRMPDRILESRMATCLDVALLAAACLEQAGLHALVVVVRGHAFTGVWLEDECFAEPAVFDGLRVRKRVDLGEMAVFDPTGVTARPALEFERAEAEARRQLGDAERFVCAIDVRRARKGRIRPLPERAPSTDASAASSASETGRREPTAPDVSRLVPGRGEDGAAAQSGKETPRSRLDRWCRKLLDLSLRNKLLNFRDTTKSLVLQCPDLGRLEDLLAGGKSFRVLPRPDDLGERDPRDAAAHERRTGQEALRELLLEELESRRLRASVTADELERRMIEIYRAARLGLEEGGASGLYLSLGSLAWYETPQSPQRRLAPILLVPLEVHRSSVREGFTLQMGDDEPRINVTLLEMLKQDFDLRIEGLDPLPEDDAGLDVPGILNAVRRAVRDIDRWDVVEEARIGLFSFTKFLMWRDLSERVEDLLKNAVVDHLVNRPNHAFDDGGEFPSADRLDRDRPPAATFCPMPADSSQLAAVFAAADGRSFVLEGPPGTGKSQTITNLIAHCLADGKTVLFVSEKMAALNVVHRRLVSVGLGRYCLELHSNKAQKRAIIQQLDEALARLEAHSDEEWAREARRVGELRTELNGYVDSLHRRRASGETVFQATSRLIGLRDAVRVDLRWPDPEALDIGALDALRDRVKQLMTAAETCGELAAHPWAGTRKPDWTPGWQEEVERASTRLCTALDALAERARACASTLGFADSGWSAEELELLLQLGELLLSTPEPTVELIVTPDWGETEVAIERWTAWGKKRDELRAEVQAQFRDDLLRLDLDALRAQLAHARASWGPLRWWRKRAVRRALLPVVKVGRMPSDSDLPAQLDRALALRAVQAKLDGVAAQAQKLLGCYWRDGEAEWSEVAGLRGWVAQLRALATRAAGSDLQRAATLRHTWAQLATEGRALLAPDGALGRELVHHAEAHAGFIDARQKVEELLQLKAPEFWGDAASRDVLGRMRARCVRWQGSMRQLRDWCAWRRARAEAVERGLGPLIVAYQQGSFAARDIARVFERSYTQWWLGAIVDREPVLSRFFSPEQTRKIEDFRAADERHMELTREVLNARLAARVPAVRGASMPNSEMGILKREVGRRRGNMAVRQLLQRIPTLLPRLKPCLLMSPMSVAQYLAADHPPFDLVVFDEASQIPVWDAVGAIARGKQAVIVGDPKQLPPTSFFQRAEEDSVEDEEVEDLESILDDCIGAQIPCLRLDWHYRSRHESLITFSNYHYYDNRLLTFPSPALEGLGVSWRHVPGGVYDRGKTRTNRAEADALVAEILRRLRDPELSRYSMGVVTFSQAQQTLIEDLLDAERRRDPSLEPFFAEDREEPLFVKNLENVQGDEREVILFSICYGPDASGRPSMNFGPMNRSGGERRLNVAITRARREVLVFSTLTADQIDLSRSQARGVSQLKGFLEYAERGPRALAAATLHDSSADFDSPFEEAVFAALVERGWDVHKQVGCARYRIDLAVVDPEARGRYLLGIECDGANYHRAKTARDRDKLREGVLRDLGWNLHRIWSTDWWTDPQREIEKLQRALESARESRSRPQSIAEPPPVARIAAAPAPAAGRQPTAPAPEEPAEELERYRPAVVRKASGSQSDFYEAAARNGIRERLIQVVRAEGPIGLGLAARRVAEAWGFERIRERALERVRGLIPPADIRVCGSDDDCFLWPAALDPESYASFRVPGPDGAGLRSPEELPPEEVANALVHLLDRHGSAPEEELIREASRLFGFQRAGHLVQDRMRTGLEVLRRRGRIAENGGTVVLVR